MKHCPNCTAEIEDNFEICWNCNYIFLEQKVIAFDDPALPAKATKTIQCLHCNVPMPYNGQYKFHEGTRTGALGNLFELFVNREAFNLYICPQCGKVEFYLPEKRLIPHVCYNSSKQPLPIYKPFLNFKQMP